MGALAATTATGAQQFERNDRHYRLVTLDNGLKVTLVSDPDAERAAAAMDVAAGHAHNPDDRAGLAHLLEHCLFLGTDDYPEPGAFRRFIGAHQGRQNAHTGFERSGYHFTVEPAHLQGALDRFARFFVAPRFAPKAVAKARRTVASEFELRRQKPHWQERLVRKQAFNPAHPLARFPIGNHQTLADRPGEPVRADLERFFKRWYTAESMSLSVIGPQPIDELSQWVKTRFAAIAEREGEGERPAFDAPLMKAAQTPKRVNRRPPQKQRKLRLTFELPALSEHRAAKPGRYLAHLLEFTGEGGLLKRLKRRGWVGDLKAGLGRSHRDGASFYIALAPTRDGMSRIPSIVEEVFAYLRLMGAQGVSRERFRRLGRSAELSQLGRDPQGPLAHVRALARRRQHLPAADLLPGAERYRYDGDAIHQVLARLVPTNLLLEVTGDNVEVSQREPWTDAAYQLTSVDPQTLERWQSAKPSSAMRLAPPNPFLDTPLKVNRQRPSDTRVERIHESGGLQAFYAPDFRPEAPRTAVYARLGAPDLNASARAAVMTELMSKLLEAALDTERQHAQQAGLDSRLVARPQGITLALDGYSAHTGLLLSRVLDAFQQFDPSARVFRLYKGQLMRELANRHNRSAYRRALSALKTTLVTPSWSAQQKLAALGSVTREELRRFARRYRQRLHARLLVRGRIERQEAAAMADTLAAATSAPAREEPGTSARRQVVSLAAGQKHFRRIPKGEAGGTAVAVFHQSPDTGASSRAAAKLLGRLIRPAFFHQLRTEQATGYITLAAPVQLIYTSGLVFLLQSSERDAATLVERTQRFARGFTEHLSELTEAQFERHKQALLDELAAHEPTLIERARAQWNGLSRSGQPHTGDHELQRALRKLSRADLLGFYRRLVSADQRKRLIVHNDPEGALEPAGPASSAKAEGRIHNPLRFKADSDYFDFLSANRSE